MTVSRAALIWGVREQESGGDYAARNASSGALGAYQVMPGNVAAWTREALGRVLTPAQYLASPADQDAVADQILGTYYDRYGPEGAASAWYCGDPAAYRSTSPEPGGPSVAQYVAAVIGRARQAPAGVTLPLSGGSAGAGGAGASTGAGAADAAPSGLLGIPGQITDFFSAATDDLAGAARFFGTFGRPSTWLRVGAGGLGTLLLIAGLAALSMAVWRDT